MDITSIIDGRKATGMLTGLIVGFLGAVAAIAAGPAAAAYIPQWLLFVGTITGIHQGAQATQDVAKASASAPAKPADTGTPLNGNIPIQTPK